MYIPSYPEDSTLRRHYESAAAFKRAARLRMPPTDSVLRRHYEQLNQTKPTATAPARPQSSPQSGGDSAASASGGGFFGWLKRLFS